MTLYIKVKLITLNFPLDAILHVIHNKLPTKYKIDDQGNDYFGLKKIGTNYYFQTPNQRI